VNKFLVTLFFLLLLSFEAGAATWYVRPNADCPAFNGNGTAYACATSNNGAGALRGFPSVSGVAIAAGDTVMLCGTFAAADKDFGTLGDSGSAMLDLTSAITGSSGNRLTFTGDCSAAGGPSRATINGGGVAGVGYGLRFAGAYITLEKVDLVDMWAASNAAISMGTSTTEPAANIVRDVTITNAGLTGCTNCNAIEINSNGFTVDSVTVDGAGTDGIYVGNGLTGAAGGTISNSTLNNISMTSVNGDGVQQEPAGGPLTINNVSVTLNAQSIKACFLAGNASNAIVIEDSECEGSGAVAGGIVIDGAGVGSYVARNYLHNTVGGAGIYLRDDAAQIAAPLKVRSNIVSGYLYGLLLDGTHSSYPEIANNVIFGSSQYGALATSSWNPAAGTILSNNVISASGYSLFVDTAVAAADWNASNNDYPGSGTFHYRGSDYSTLSAYVTAASKDVGSIASAPALLGGPSPTTAEGFRPLPSSPLIGAGSPLGAKYDYEGYRFGNPPNIGAFVNNGPNSYSRRSNYDRRTTFPSRY
jgi:hypothetical protein